MPRDGAESNLCGGVASGDPRSFRGEICFALILDMTGESLYNSFVPPKRVSAVYEAFRGCGLGEFGHCDYRFGEPEDQIGDLRKFFKVRAEQNLGIASWW